MGKVPDDLNEIDAVEAEVDTLRDRTQQLVAELERRLRARAAQAKETLERVRDVVDVKKQIRLHPRVTIGVSTVAALALGLGVYVAVSRRLAARRPMQRLRARLHAYRALLAEPQHLVRPREPSFGKRLVSAMLIAGATTIARGLAIALVVKRVARPPRRLPSDDIEIEYV